MRRLLLILSSVLLLTIVGDGRAENPTDTATFMRLKLAHSQKLLEGIALEDFSLIQKSARDLSLLSHEAGWRVFQTPDYVRHSEDFRKSVETIRKAAADKNVDAAALGYVGMTLNCVNCHKYVRDVRMAGRPNQDASFLAGN